MMKSKTSTPTQNNSKFKIQRSKFERVLSVDPGFDRVGVAILEKNLVLFSECIVTDRKNSHSERLGEIGIEINKVIKKWKPDSLAIETLFFNQNVSTAIKVAEARGVVIYEASRANLEVFEYSPQAIKIAITGYGKANKQQVENMLQRLVKLPADGEKKLDDELDAIALGITHLASQRGI